MYIVFNKKCSLSPQVALKCTYNVMLALNFLWKSGCRNKKCRLKKETHVALSNCDLCTSSRDISVFISDGVPYINDGVP